MDDLSTARFSDDGIASAISGLRCLFRLELVFGLVFVHVLVRAGSRRDPDEEGSEKEEVAFEVATLLEVFLAMVMFMLSS
ncbi:hypothetical protein AK812_SmicGene34180 [Symbiodinium microadriaticum]|uniref:Uncharacterized protein n=1 Tax=Symbiodinium microadriaticum TaxID=2951 RepID=A0A1Q9CPP4_SYMMI|nr:hypothetical protein AK812_SmicGene34180 [Symbiodinium microadriaticum]